ncbi:hypothetical protein TRVA0_008S01200 [Trichomonascus vanleenenianus]|uniref:uncharacterized protein n=1 Tax=Trichomonascus vanleenenianus TaxID=2268995 RepID=UPI003EC9A5BB
MNIPRLLRTLRRSYSTVVGQPHYDLQSFLKFCESNPPNKTTTFQGLAYEYNVKYTLEQLFGAQLMRCGGSGDTGVDLRGRCFVGGGEDIQIIVQCKSSKTKVPGKLLREMDGVYSYHVMGSEDEKKTVIIVAAANGLTKQGLAHFERTNTPLISMQIDHVAPLYDRKRAVYHMDSVTKGGVLRSMMFNSSAKTLLQDKGIVINRVISPEGHQIQCLKS